MPEIQKRIEFLESLKNTKIRCVYTNHRGETRVRHLDIVSIVSLIYGPNLNFQNHQDIQWFLECYDLEKRNQNQVEGTRLYPINKITFLTGEETPEEITEIINDIIGEKDGV